MRKAISKWENENDAYLDLFESIKKVVEQYDNLKPKDDFIDSLEKIPFVSNVKDKLILSDIFVWSSAEQTTLRGKSETKELNFDFLRNNKNKFSLIIGEEAIGKTSLLNQLFLHGRGKKYFPVIFDGNNIHKSLNFDEILKNELERQYGNNDITLFKSHNNKILLVDDYSAKNSENFIKWAKENFQIIIICMRERDYLLYYKDSSAFAPFDIFSLNPFSKEKKFDLLCKWQKVKCTNIEDLEREVDELERKVDDVILNKKIVPCFPFYILSVLQSIDVNTSQNYKITSYGHCYYVLILSQLFKKGIEAEDINDALNYLEKLAYHIFASDKNHTWQISSEEYESFKSKYKETYITKDSVINYLENNDYPILKNGEYITFEYLYTFFYCLGKYLASSIDEKTIEKLCSNIHKKDYSYILIFIIHHTTDVRLLEEIQLHCMISFDNISPVTLSTEETNFMTDLIDNLPNKILASKSTNEMRKEERKLQDEYEEENSKDEYEDNLSETTSNDVDEILKAYKIIEVLGQIVKNRAGSLEKKKIKELVNEVEELGFRILSFVLSELKNDEFEKWLETRLQALENQTTETPIKAEKRKQFIQFNVKFMSTAIIMGMLTKIFSSVATEKIMEIQKEVSSQKNTVAFDFLDILFHLQYKGLTHDFTNEYSKKFKDTKNIWAERVFSYFVQNYMNTHHIKVDEKQKISHLLGIEFSPNRI